MSPTKEGSFHLFRAAGIDVYLHWSWLFVAIYQIQERAHRYTSLTWNVLEYLTLFLIVLLHEFGHSLACRQTGGTANQIVLWPLGGVAYVAPPQRAGAVLWSIAAGPLVNVVLFVFLTVATRLAAGADADAIPTNAGRFLHSVWLMNTWILVFNLLPVYPLDGGQILRALLWFPLGRARSLHVATIIGFIGAAGLVAVALWWQSIWMGVLAAFVFMNCRNGWQQARALAAAATIPRRAAFSCPSCGASPPVGAFWKCGRCGTAFDTYATNAECPNCHEKFPSTHCLDCGAANPMSAWTFRPPQR
jgi:Zn-dependent protease